MKQMFILNSFTRARAIEALRAAPDGHVVRISEPTRSLDQNAKLWPMLTDVSKQVDWYSHKLTPDEWKDVFSSAIVKAKVVPGLDGGFVVCGQRTSQMSKAMFSELIELMYAFGAEHDVVWSEPAQRAYDDYRRAA